MEIEVEKFRGIRRKVTRSSEGNVKPLCNNGQIRTSVSFMPWNKNRKEEHAFFSCRWNRLQPSSLRQLTAIMVTSSSSLSLSSL
jgi:hypothetical protein